MTGVILINDDIFRLMNKGKNYLLIIGIDKYPDPNISNLHNAVRDAQDIKKLLIDQYDFDPDHTIELYNDEATRKNIYGAFRRLRKKIKSEADNLLIYYSGHGYFDEETDSGYWLPNDASKDEEDTYIENSSITKTFIKPIKTKHTLLISDSCYSGSIFARGNSRSLGFNSLNELYKRKSRWALCSGRGDEEVGDGRPGANSPFAKSLMGFLESNEAPLVNIAKIANYVIEVTASKARQLPEGNPLYIDDHEGGQFVFRRKGYNEQLPDPKPEPIEQNQIIETEVLPENENSIISKVREMISEGESKEAIKILMKYDAKKDDDNFQNTLFLLSARLSRLTKGNNSGTISERDYSLESNKINFALLEILSDLKE